MRQLWDVSCRMLPEAALMVVGQTSCMHRQLIILSSQGSPYATSTSCSAVVGRSVSMLAQVPSSQIGSIVDWQPMGGSSKNGHATSMGDKLLQLDKKEDASGRD